LVICPIALLKLVTVTAGEENEIHFGHYDRIDLTFFSHFKRNLVYNRKNKPKVQNQQIRA